MKCFLISILAAISLFCGGSKTSQDRLSWLYLNARNHFAFSRPDPGAPAALVERPRSMLVNLIRESQNEILIWCYEFDEPAIIEALAFARQRGVSIRIIGTSDYSYKKLEAAGLPVFPRKKSGLQHSKIMLFDQKRIFSGTGNFTISDFFHSNNAFFYLELTGANASRIKQMLETEGTLSPPVWLDFNGRLLVSPGRGRLIQTQLVKAILSAKYSIQFMIFSHTDPVISSALRFKAAQGILVEGIYDDPNNKGIVEPGSEADKINSSLGALPSAIYLDGNRSVFEKDEILRGGHLHHKTIIIDEHRVLTGSYNWSAGARDSNMEIFFDFSSFDAAAVFIEEFDRVRAAAFPLARPPAIADQGGRLSFVNGSFCAESAPSEFTVFSGSRHFFRAEHFRPANPSQGCLRLADGQDISAGVFGASLSPDLAPGSSVEPAVYSFGYSAARNSPGAASDLPCENVECNGFTFRSRPSEGWIWTQPAVVGAEYIRFWTQTGITSRIALTRTGPGLYSFPAVLIKSDALVFLESGSGAHYAGCLASGGLPRALKQFMDALEYASDQNPVCADINN